MNKKVQNSIVLRQVKNSLLSITVVALSFACHKPTDDQKYLKDFKQVNLVANTDEYNPVIVDTTLINGFGIAWSQGGTAWVNSVGGHVSELYSADGAIVRPPIKIPAPTDSVSGLPCGIVSSAGKGFNLSNGPSSFLFTGFDGVLSGWNGASGVYAKRLAGPEKASNYSYTGLAIGSSNERNFIYGANFGTGKIDVWNTAFSEIKMSFKDPTLPAGYSPYNIQAIGDLLYVVYGKLGSDGHGVPGQGSGYVSIFNTNGSFVKRFASGGTLNLPWGVTITPANFLENEDMGNNGGDGGYGSLVPTDKSASFNPKDPVILVGNFGDGRINVFTQDGKYLGQLQTNKHVIAIHGLWALSFAPTSVTTIDPSRLYFTAGPDHENDGIFGYLIKK